MCKFEFYEFFCVFFKCEYYVYIEGIIILELFFGLVVRNQILFLESDLVYVFIDVLYVCYRQFILFDDFLQYYFIGFLVFFIVDDFVELIYIYFKFVYL